MSRGRKTCPSILAAANFAYIRKYHDLIDSSKSKSVGCCCLLHYIREINESFNTVLVCSVRQDISWEAINHDIAITRRN